MGDRKLKEWSKVTRLCYGNIRMIYAYAKKWLATINSQDQELIDIYTELMHETAIILADRSMKSHACWVEKWDADREYNWFEYDEAPEMDEAWGYDEVC